MNILGQYLLVSLGFVVAAVIEFAFVDHLNRVADLKRKFTKENSASKNTKDAILSLTKLEKANSKVKPAQKNEAKKKSIFILVLSSIRLFDFVAFLLHFLAFLAFNIVYWNQNLN